MCKHYGGAVSFRDIIENPHAGNDIIATFNEEVDGINDKVRQERAGAVIRELRGR